MKKKLSILLTLCLLLALPALAYTDNNIIAHRAPGDVTIDGNLGEWNTESAAVMNTAEQVVRDVGQWTDESDLSVQAYLMWDEENLYLGATILDDTPFMYREGFPPIWPIRWCCSFPPTLRLTRSAPSIPPTTSA